MSRKLKKSVILPVALLIYLAAMSYIGYADYASGKSTPLYYFGIIGITLVAILLLHLSLRRKEKLRQEGDSKFGGRNVNKS